jgi:Muconolactone delta-isomerase
MQQEYQFMVDFSLPKVLSEDFLRLIPHQRAKVNKLFRDGKLINYALSLDNSKIWAIVNANSELDVLELVSQLPLTRFMQYKINLLTVFNSVNAESPVFSMN